MEYDIFHKDTKIQHRIIDKKNFTYRISLSVLSRYLTYATNVLDVGCGSGSIAFCIANMGKKVVGIDISSKAIDICSKTSKVMGLSNIAGFEVADGSNFISNQKFDLIICTEVLEHLKDDKQTVKNFFKILNHGGSLFISVPSKNSPIFRLGLSNQFDKTVGHLRRYSTEELEELLRKVGYEVLETRKVEGILRNFLFLNPVAKNFIRFIKGPISDLVTFFDNLLVPLFGEADIIIVARKK